ncbi:hypothetical protein LDENG_00137910 [Lucifuga dentata]|nr:hypothetical protein LDENG_00137910 [Lucifuga dentata]
MQNWWYGPLKCGPLSAFFPTLTLTRTYYISCSSLVIRAVCFAMWTQGRTTKLLLYMDQFVLKDHTGHFVCLSLIYSVFIHVTLLTIISQSILLER